MAKGDKDAQFLKNYQNYKNKILNYFWYRVNFDRELAEDLTSEIFLKAYDKYDQYDPDRPFQSWIFAIAHNHLVNFYRSSNRTIPLDEAIEIIKTDDVSLEDQFDIKRIINEIANLPDYQKEILTLRYINELSHGEIAEIMERDETTIRVAIHRALKMIKDKITPPGGTE
jgi:RNA polymerase sigma-70 factor (ECF subfamily)